MNKTFVIDTVAPGVTTGGLANQTQSFRGALLFPRGEWWKALVCLAFYGFLGVAAVGQEPENGGVTDADGPVPAYPLSVAVAPDGSLVVVDLDLPGVWRLPAEGGKPQWIVRGADRFRERLNRPRCCVVLSDGAILVGDTATREIYRISADGEGEPEALTGGVLGVPNSLALAEGGDGESTLYVADLETRFVFRLPVSGGKPELYSRTLVRGLHLDSSGTLWGVTPTAEPLVKLAAKGEPSVVVGERAFEFPHNVVVAEDGAAYVTDGYAKKIWRVDSEGQVEAWLSGAPLVNPVGLALGAGKLYVADPHAKQIFEVDLASKQIRPLVQP